MKHLTSIFINTIFLACLSTIAYAQDPREVEIKRLENLEREAVLKGDSVALFNKIWSPTMVINTPANVVGTVEGTKVHLRSGGLNYLSFERSIEKITFNDNVAVVMGGEIIRPQGQQVNAGKTVSRRFTNVWLYKNNAWSIIARQATIIKVEWSGVRPEGHFANIASNEEFFAEPMLFEMPFFGLAPKDYPLAQRQPLTHESGLREITKISVTLPLHIANISSAMQQVLQSNIVKVTEGKNYFVSLELDYGKKKEAMDFNPLAPLALVR